MKQNWEETPCTHYQPLQNPMIEKLVTSRTKLVAAIVTTGLVTMPALFAQAAAGTTVEKKTLLQKWVIDGGPTMLFIGAAIVAFIALTVFNFMNMTKAKYCPDDLKMALMDHMTNVRVRSAIELAASHPSYLGRLVAYSFPNIDATRPEDLGRDQVEDAMADFSSNETRKSMTWINYISLCAQASPMLGLLGTVIGMVGCFGTLAESGSADPSQLAGDISVALLTTLWGLVNAIPCISMFFFFKNRLTALTAESIKAAEDMMNAATATVNADTIYAKIPEGIA
jgi:biopolymer transport protein ExbB